ncbi:MAG: DUF427 domain-containing protein [Bacteroidetes bacterium]|nr:DUF427 domain-containing protein [Bacteroidota bacterium]MDA1121701.1 DUF427 domain-containing protein [Bacteroidota bacterium]
MKAIWNDEIIAESDKTIVVENNHYFPPAAIKKEFFTNSEIQTVCPWKGTAHYYTIKIGDEANKDAAWYYPSPSELAKNIKGYIAFWRGVKITE